MAWGARWGLKLLVKEPHPMAFKYRFFVAIVCQIRAVGKSQIKGLQFVFCHCWGHLFGIAMLSVM